MPKISPRSTVNDTSCTATRSPYRLCKLRTSIAGIYASPLFPKRVGYVKKCRLTQALLESAKRPQSPWRSTDLSVHRAASRHPPLGGRARRSERRPERKGALLGCGTCGQMCAVQRLGAERVRLQHEDRIRKAWYPQAVSTVASTKQICCACGALALRRGRTAASVGGASAI